MPLILKEMYSPDVPVPLKRWAPERYDEVYVYVELLIGFGREDGGQSFGVVVATPRGLALHTDQTVLSGRGHIIMRYWHYEALHRYIQGELDRIRETSWDVVPRLLREHFIEV